MSRKTLILIGFNALYVAAAWAQDSTANPPSLGEIARQYRNQKNASQPATVITNDNLPSSSPVSVLGLAAPSAANSASNTRKNPSPEEALNRWDNVIKQIEAIDRAKMISLALQGSTADFPGRSDWESRLIAAKEMYVRDGHDLIRDARDLLAKARALEKDHADASDPRARELQDKLKDFVTRAMKIDANFQAIIMEGRDLARHAATGPSNDRP